MHKKVKHFFRKKQLQNDKKHTASSNVDICNVNIVSEAEKIIEEYALKMGYKFMPQKNSRAPVIFGIFFALSAFLLLLCFVWKF